MVGPSSEGTQYTGPPRDLNTAGVDSYKPSGLCTTTRSHATKSPERALRA